MLEVTNVAVQQRLLLKRGQAMGDEEPDGGEVAGSAAAWEVVGSCLCGKYIAASSARPQLTPLAWTFQSPYYVYSQEWRN